MLPLLLAILLLVPLSAQAGATPAQNCQSAKNKEVAKYASCRQKAEAKYAVKLDAAARLEALQSCLAKYEAKWPKLEQKAEDGNDPCPSTGDQTGIQAAADAYTTDIATALAGGPLSSCPVDLATCEAALASAPVCGNGAIESGEQCEVDTTLDGSTCVTQGFAGGILRCAPGCALDTSGCYATRFVDNGDGTVTDRKTRLQWEQKTTAVGSGGSATDPHDVDNYYGVGGNTATVFHSFLARLNWSAKFPDSALPVGGWPHCLGRRCDWRMPTINELKSIIDLTAPGCGAGSPCIDPVFGPTYTENAPGFNRTYFSSTEYAGVPSSNPLSGTLDMWTVDFYDGSVLARPDQYRARAVRGSTDFVWVVSNWGTCSVTCGGGVRTRTVSCHAHTGEIVGNVSENFCKGAGTRPATQQSCNPNPC